MTLATLRALAVAEQMPDWWIAHLDAYRKKYPRRTAAQYFKGLRDRNQADWAFVNLLEWDGDYFSEDNDEFRVDAIGAFRTMFATTAQLSAALSRAFGED